MNNKEIREKIAKKRLKHYEVAQAIGITQYTFSHWLQTEMSQEQKQIVLKAIKDLEEQDLLLRLPCKIGDRLYKIDYDYLGNIISDTVHSIHILRNTVYLEMKYWHNILLSEIGKTVFLTQAEAEQKLKEMESK